MPIVFRNPTQLKPLERFVSGPWGDLTLYARRPSVRESLEADAAETPADRMHARLQIFVDWAGVLDESGEPVPFSERAFAEVCEQQPAILWAAVNFASEIFMGRTDLGNSAAPSPIGCAAAPATILQFPDGAGLPDSAG